MDQERRLPGKRKMSSRREERQNGHIKKEGKGGQNSMRDGRVWER